MDLTGRFFLFLLVMLTLICLTSCAATVTSAAPAHYVAIAAPPAPQAAPAPPDDGVALRTARISYIEGPVTMQRMADEDWTNAEINAPLMAGDKIFSGAGARVEIQLEDETVLRLGENTYLEFKILDDGLGRIGVVKGVLSVHANRVSYARPPLEIMSSYFSSSIPVNAIARYDVDENGPARIQVRRGEVNVEKSDKSSLALRRDEQLIVNSPDSADFKIAALSPEDDFDRWSDMRDAAIAASQTRQYVSTRVAGYSDLDNYGDWVAVKDYGRVWRPRVIASNWAPYREGRWVWRDPYGWIWVSYEPWGWVPYHYGRWVYTSDYDWCWVPTDVVYVTHRPIRPLWYPAMVSFAYAHHGSYFSIGFGGGYYDGPCVGWFPLGPHDPFYPWYDYRASYVHRYHHGYLHCPEYFGNNITINNNNQTIVYQNQNVENAVSVMTRRDFESGQKPPRENVAGRYAASRDVQTGPQAFASLPERRAAAVQGQAMGASPDNRSPQTEAQREPASKSPRGDNSFEKVNAAPAAANMQTSRSSDAKPAREAAGAASYAAPQSQREANARAEKEPQANPTQEDRRAPAAKSSRVDSQRTASPMTAPASAQSAREARSDANVSAPRTAAPQTTQRTESFWNRPRSTRTAAPDNSASTAAPARSGPEAKVSSPRTSDSSNWNRPRSTQQEAPRTYSSPSSRSSSASQNDSPQPSAPRASAPSSSSSRTAPQSANPSRSISPQRMDSGQSAPRSSSSPRSYDSAASQPRVITPAQVPSSRQSAYMTPYDRRSSSSYSAPSSRSYSSPRSYSAVPQTYNSIPSYSPSRQSRMYSSPSRSYSPSYSVPRNAAPSYSVPRSAVQPYSAPRSAAPSYSAPSFSPQRSSSYSAPRMSSPAPSSRGGSSYSPRRAGR